MKIPEKAYAGRKTLAYKEETPYMLKRVKIQGYKSLVDIDVTLQPLTVLVGPNAAGKSNFLDALQLLSRIATSRTLQDAFKPPYRGYPLESFTFGPEGMKRVMEQTSASFSLEVDVELSSNTIEFANKYVQQGVQDTTRKRLSEKYIHYRIDIEITPKSGKLRVLNEEVGEFTETGEQKYGVGQKGDHSLFSRAFPHVPDPQIIALQQELEDWAFFYFEPRERMRESHPVRAVNQPGLRGEDVGVFLNTLKATNETQFRAIEKALAMMIPSITGIDIAVNDHTGEVELSIMEDNTPISARVVSEGTLRVLGLLAVGSMQPSPKLIGFEEPENGVHPRRIRQIAEFLNTRAMLGNTQWIVTTHSPILPDKLPERSLYVCRRDRNQTRIEPISKWALSEPVYDIESGLDEDELTVSERILRGDFDA